jgi:hypothetical protein
MYPQPSHQFLDGLGGQPLGGVDGTSRCSGRPNSSWTCILCPLQLEANVSVLAVLISGAKLDSRNGSVTRKSPGSLDAPMASQSARR